MKIIMWYTIIVVSAILGISQVVAQDELGKFFFNHQTQLSHRHYYFQEEMVVCLQQSFVNLPD